jgi:hypothetical protein
VLVCLGTNFLLCSCHAFDPTMVPACTLRNGVTMQVHTKVEGEDVQPSDDR